MTQKEINELSTKDLAERVIEEKKTLLKFEMSHKVSPIENPLKIRATRRTVARLNTELTKRKLAEVKK